MKKNRKHLVVCANLMCLFLLSISATKANAQQTALFPQGFEINPIAYPAVADQRLMSEGRRLLQVQLCWRQPLQFPEGPRTDFASLDYYHTKKKYALITGGQFYQFNTDPIFQTKFTGRFAFYKRLGGEREAWLGVGLSGGLLQYKVKTESLIPIFPDDPIVLATTRRLWGPALGAGAYYIQHLRFGRESTFNRDYLFASFSIPQIRVPQKKSTEAEPFRINQVAHYYLMAGMKKQVTSNQFFIEPVFMLKKVQNVPLHAQVNMRCLYNPNREGSLPFLLMGFGIAGTGMMQLEFGYEFPIKVPVLVRLAYGFSTQAYHTQLSNVLEMSLSSRIWNNK